MPRGKVDSARKVIKRGKKETSQQVNSDSAASNESMEILNSPAISETAGNGMKEDTDSPQDFNGEMSKLLERFSSDMNKTLQAKRKKLEQFTQESTRSTTKKVLETNKAQSYERRKLIDHFQSQFFAMIEQGHSEIEKIKETEDKLQKLLVQQQKHQQQVRNSYSQRMKALKNLSEEFCKGMNDLEESHIEQYSAVHSDLRKEMALLQKKILMETQQQEMSNVRKHLKQLIA